MASKSIQRPHTDHMHRPQKNISGLCTITHTSKSIASIASISLSGAADFLAFAGATLAFDVYAQIWHDIIAPWLDQLFDGEPFYFQEDGASCHFTPAANRMKRSLIGDNLFPHGLWSPNSPDMSLIEHAWSTVAMEIRRRNPQTLAGLKRAAQAAWDSIDEGYLDSLWESIDRRAEAVLEANGGATKY